MAHKIYGPPEHQLTTVQFFLELPRRATNYQATLRVHGRSATQRADLWVANEVFAKVTPGRELSCIDALHHIALASLQDRPQTQRQLELALRGGDKVEEVQLPF